MQGKFDYISTEQVLTFAKVRLGLTDVTDFDDELSLYINEGARHLNNPQTFVPKKADLDFTHGQAKVPCGFQKFIAVYFAGVNVFYAAKKYFNTIDYDGTNTIDSKGTVDIINGYLDVGCSQDGVGTLWYEGANIDDEGWFLIPSSSERGLVAYACGNYKMERPAIYGNNAGQPQLNLYSAQKRWLNGELRKDEAEADRYQLAAIMNSRSMDRLDGYLGSIFANLHAPTP
jgi:hypothetical protein